MVENILTEDSIGTTRTVAHSSRLARLFFALALLLALLVRLPAVAPAYPYFAYIDEGHVLHAVALMLDGQPWDPRTNGYPALSVVAIAGVARLVAFVVDPWRTEPLLRGVGSPYYSYDQITPPELIVVGQVSCLLVSIGCVLLVGLLGRRVAGGVAGAVAAWAAALLPALVVRGAIVTVDGFATFFVLAAALAVAAVRGPRDLGRLAIAGACCGLAFVSKYPAGLIGLAVVATVALAPWSPAQRLWGVTVAAAAGAAAAIMVMPAFILQPQAVWDSMVYQRWFYDSLELGSYWVQAFQFGEWDLPLPYPELGIVFTLLAAAGAALMLASRPSLRLILGWLLFGVVLVATHASFSLQPFRNLLPLAALCCVSVGFLAGSAAARLRRPRSVLVGASALLSVLFFAPVRHHASDRLALADSRRDAIDWILANRPTARVLVQREAAFVRTDLARLGSRAQVVRGREIARVSPDEAPVLVIAHVLRADSKPLLDEHDATRLKQRYQVSAAFGEATASATMKGWKGNRMRIWILEPKPAPTGDTSSEPDLSDLTADERKATEPAVVAIAVNQRLLLR